jgi:integrase
MKLYETPYFRGKVGREWGENKTGAVERGLNHASPMEGNKLQGRQIFPTRKHGVGRDKYFAIRYQRNGKRIEEGLGWTSELDPKDKKHWTAEKAAIVLAGLKEAAKGLEKGPTRLREKRQIEDNRKEAEKTERERLEKEAVTFDAFFDDTYLPQAKTDKKPRSVAREEGLYGKWIKSVIGHFPVKEIAPFHLEKLKKVMADGKQSPRSIEYALAVVRQVFNTAKRLRVYDGESPTSQVKSPKVDNGRMRFLTRVEATAILNALKTKSTDVHDMTLLSLHCGLRFGEIAALTWQDVDLSKGVLTIRDAKAGSRYAFLTRQAVGMFKNRPKEKRKPSDYVFKGRKGLMDRISVTFARTVEELKLNEGIDDPRLQICFHSCRHSYASWLIDQGADLYTVQKLLGHKTNVMTQRYAHLSENRLKDAAKALGKAWQKHETAQKDKEGDEQVANLSK